MPARSTSPSATPAATASPTATWSRCWRRTWRPRGDAVPRLVAQLEGIAEGAGLRFIDVFAVNAFEELYAVLEGSVPAPTASRMTLRRRRRRSSAAPTSSSRGPDTTILAHNEQWYAGDDGGVAVIVERPDSDDEVAIVAPASVGTLPLVGMNARGGALGLMSLTGADEQVGVPRALLGRDGVEAVDRDDALRRATQPPPCRRATATCTRSAAATASPWR